MRETDLSCSSLRLRGGRLQVLDQTRLPGAECWQDCATAAQAVEHIQNLRVRGAPLIAIVAALLVALRIEAGDERAAITEAIATLRAARPTAVNLMHAMDRLTAALEQGDWRARVAAEALAIFAEDRALCEAIAENGAALIAPGERLLTHCNTGGLATAGIGTALGVIRRAQEQGKQPQVWVDETRPLLQGARLTAWELEKAGVAYRLITDSAAAAVMAAGECDKVIVGADRIAANGDFANKVGTYALAVLARHHRIPFYVAAPTTTVDAACADGAGIPIEQRAGDEVRGAAGAFGKVNWSPAGAPVYNPAFDVTPAALVSGWILDSGVYDQAAVASGVLRRARSAPVNSPTAGTGPRCRSR